MRELGHLSGPWSGFWIQGRRRGDMALSLSFSNSNIQGQGDDLVGPFGIGGAFSDQTHQVQFIKSYTSFTVFYSGVWDGEMIAGLWTKRYGSYQESGEFEIWPDTGEAVGLQEVFEAAGAVA